MQITVQDRSFDGQLVLEFVKYYPLGMRLWIRDPRQHYQTVGRFCPHRNLGDMECQDCALNVE